MKNIARGFIQCNLCHEVRLPSRKDSIFCSDCDRSLETKMRQIDTSPSDELFERIARNNR